MKALFQFFRRFFLLPNFFLGLGLICLLFLAGIFFPILVDLGWTLLFVLLSLTLIEGGMALIYHRNIAARRVVANRLSNGDPNEVLIFLNNRSPIPWKLTIEDESPYAFQLRELRFKLLLKGYRGKKLRYFVHPTQRGVYGFGRVNILLSSILGLAGFKQQDGQAVDVAVYPSYLQMRKFELLAISDRLETLGIKRIRRAGNTTEFDRISDYVPGDELRHVNWKATARRNKLMTNRYTDEKAQPVYHLLDMGRSMRSPFDGMTLLDYSINAALAVSSIAIRKSDKAGILAFSHRVEAFLPAERKPGYMGSIQETLYRLETQFLENNVEGLAHFVTKKMRQRSLLLLYTNYETLTSLERQLPYLKRLSRGHVLVVVFFQNTGLKSLLDKPIRSTEDVYLQTLAEKQMFEKRLCIKALEAQGIYAVWTTPKQLTVNTINKYLEMKGRGLI